MGFQQANPPPTLGAIENISLPFELDGVSPIEAKRAGTEAPGPFVVPWVAIVGIVVLAPAVVAVPFRLCSRHGTPIGAVRRPT